MCKDNISVKKLHSTDEAGGPHGQVVFNGIPIELSFSAGHHNRASTFLSSIRKKKDRMGQTNGFRLDDR